MESSADKLFNSFDNNNFETLFSQVMSSNTNKDEVLSFSDLFQQQDPIIESGSEDYSKSPQSNTSPGITSDDTISEPLNFGVPEENPNLQSINFAPNQTDFLLPMVKQEIPVIPQAPAVQLKQEKKRKRANSEKKKKQKKIRRKLPEMRTAVTLPREKLLTTTSEEFSQWVEGIKKERKLSQEEIKDIRRQKRLIKNRESAQASRDRKKRETEEMQRKIELLEQQNRQAMAQISQMQATINSLETENRYMKTTIQQNPTLSNLYENLGTGLDSVSTFEPKKSSSVSKSNFARNAKTAGVCLFIIFFSFGLFFNSQNGILSSTQPKPINVGYVPNQVPQILSRSRAPISNPVPGTMRLQNNRGRKLLWDSSVPEKQKAFVSNEPTFAHPIKLEDQSEIVVLASSTSAPVNETISENERMESEPDLHLYCLKANEVLTQKAYDPNNFVLSLMVPKSSLSQNSRILAHTKSQDDLVEVKCKVINNPQTVSKLGNI